MLLPAFFTAEFFLANLLLSSYDVEFFIHYKFMKFEHLCVFVFELSKSGAISCSHLLGPEVPLCRVHRPHLWIARHRGTVGHHRRSCRSDRRTSIPQIFDSEVFRFA